MKLRPSAEAQGDLESQLDNLIERGGLAATQSLGERFDE